MTTETKDTQTEQEIENSWKQLFEFIKKEISWIDGTVDFDSFFEFGSKKFNIAIKHEKQ